MAQKTLPAWVLEDLKKSALGPELGKKLGLRSLSEEESEEVTGCSSGGSYEIPYFSLQGARLPFSRYKLHTPVSMGRGSKMRYWQPPKSPPRLYVPPIVDWKAVQADPKFEVWVTEGEKKAASLCALGVPCVAVSGVWAWKSKRLHQDLVPEFKALLPRDIVLCFDSDADENMGIKGALCALATELERRGGRVKLLDLPQLSNDSKTGLDDFIAHHKKQALKELAQLPKEPMGLSTALQRLNTELVVVKSEAEVYSLEEGKFLSTEKLGNVQYADQLVTTWDAAGIPKKASVVVEWLKWEKRRTCKRLAYRPGQPEWLPNGDFNLWTPSGVEPRKRPCPLFTQLLDFLAQNLTPEQKKWWVQWLAYPIQHPGAKLYSAVIMYSHKGGTGKTLLGYTLRRIYGEQNSAELDQTELHSTFNPWAKCRQFIIGAEISGSDKRTDSDKLKHMVSRTKVTINEKYQPAYELDDTCNYYLTTNHSDAVYIEQGDRRYFVVDTSSDPLPEKFYKAYDAFYRSDEGISAVLAHLMAVDTRDFNPQAQPPATAAKVAMHEMSGSESDGVVRDLVRNPERIASLDGQPNRRELFTLEELQSLVDPTGRISRIQLGKSLRKAGCPQPFRVGKPGERRVVVLFAVTEFEKWAKASHEERAAHYFGEAITKERRQEKIGGKATAKKTNGHARAH